MATALGRSTSTSATGDPAAFIANWQQTHLPSEGKAPLIAGLQQAGFDASPYMYGSTESGNEISLSGQRYKVLSGDEGTPGSAWYVPGSEDATAATPGTVLGQTHTAQPGSTIVGPAIVRGSQYGDAYGAAYLASQLQRKKAVAAGRSTTILGGFTPGAPTTAPATALGA